MKRDIAALASQKFDLLIIGGGIIGAGIARDAALRGLRTALVEKSDFAGGTSSRSSKLIHGGFRYLEQYDFRLVAESCRERRILREIAPHRVRPLRFLLPVYEGDPRPLWKMRLGMTLYDLLALYRNTAPHRTISAAQAVEREPGLNPCGLRGAILYYDYQENDARFCIDNVLHAAELGAVCANYVEVTGFDASNGRIAGARAADRLSGHPLRIDAAAFVNAAGPWIESVDEMMPEAHARVRLSPTKGVHLVIPRVAQSHAFAFQARSDGRILFLLPWHDDSILGTTDTDYAGDPGDARADAADVRYLLEELSALMPERRLKASDIVTTFAGVRALLRSDASTPSARTREHQVVRQAENLVSVAGGKYTTYRAIAEQTVNEVCGLLDRTKLKCQTARTALPDYRTPIAGEQIAGSPSIHVGDVERACDNEMAIEVSDVMFRRTALGLSRHGIPEIAQRVARIMAPRLAWTEDRMRQSLQGYLDERERNQPPRQ